MPDITVYCCESCREPQAEDDCIFINDNIYCSEDCANRAGWHRCEDCNRWTNDTYHNDNSQIICSNCADNYYCCESCSDIVHSNDIQSTESRLVYCESCYRDHRRENGRNRLINDYGFKPEYLFSKMPWENTVYFGIELECELPDRVNRESKALALKNWLTDNELDQYIYFKDDGSLVNGIELCFHPATLQAIHDKYKLRALLKHMAKLGFSSFASGRCGLHVHISKKKLSNSALLRGKIMFYKCQSYLKALSGRRQQGFNYCKFDTNMPSSLDYNPNGRYTALNIYASDSTLEIRIFRGTLNHDKLIAYLQFCDAFVGYIQSTGTAFYKTASPSQVWHSFIDYAKKNNKSGAFIKHVLKKGII